MAILLAPKTADVGLLFNFAFVTTELFTDKFGFSSWVFEFERKYGPTYLYPEGGLIFAFLDVVELW